MARLWLQQLLALFLFVLGIQAVYDLSQELSVTSQLGLKLEYNLARTSGSGQASPQPLPGGDKRSVVCSTHLTFNGDANTITEGQMVQMAGDAFGDMYSELGRYGFSDKAWPNIMTLVAVGQEVYMSSSVKGGRQFMIEFPASPISDRLSLCVATAKDIGGPNMPDSHKYNANCGEPMIAHQWFSTHPGKTDMLGLGARVISVRKQGDNIKIVDPCGSDFNGRDKTSWGCNLFIQKMGWTLIANADPQPYDLSNLAGGLKSTDQIPMCAAAQN